MCYFIERKLQKKKNKLKLTAIIPIIPVKDNREHMGNTD